MPLGPIALLSIPTQIPFKHKSQIEGVNTTVANVEAHLRQAQYYLDNTTLVAEWPIHLSAGARLHGPLDCPETGPGAVPNLLSDVQSKLVMSGNSVDLANEINDLINKLQIEKPNISYTELTNVIVAAYCPVVANMASLTASEKWHLMRQFDRILQQQLAANWLPAGTLLIANVPLPPAVYRELRSQAAKVDKSPAQFMAAILSRAAGN